MPRWLRWVFAALVVALAFWWFVFPRFDDASDALDLVGDVDPFRLATAGALVGLAFVAQAQMVRSVIDAHERPALFAMVRIELAGAAVSHTVPGGTAAGTALGYRLLTSAGVAGTSAGFAVGVRGVGSSLVLITALGIALAAWVPMNGFHAHFGIAIAIGIGVLAAVGAGIVTVMRTERGPTRVLTRLFGALPRLDAERVEPVVDRVVQQVRDLVVDRALALRVCGWAAVHWLAEAASLWIMVAAFGWSGSPLAVFVAFGVVNIVAIVPITPRGLGVVEAVLIPMLIALGAPGQVAALGVLAWRFLSFWAPIPIGAASYLSLRVAEVDVDGDTSDRRRRAVEELADARHDRITGR